MSYTNIIDSFLFGALATFSLMRVDRGHPMGVNIGFVVVALIAIARIGVIAFGAS